MLGEEGGLLHGGVHNHDGAIPKDGGGAVMDGAGGDTVVLEVIDLEEMEAVGDGAGIDDEGVCLDGVGREDDAERVDDEVDGSDDLGEDVCRSGATEHVNGP